MVADPSAAILGRSVSVAEAKAHLSELLTAAEAGEVISITRRGKAVATLSSAERPRKPIDLDELRALTDAMPYSEVSAVDIIREMRDAGY